MKKKLIWIFTVILVLALAATAIGPGIILNAVRQPEPAESYAYSDSFRNTYEEVRTGIRDLVATLESKGLNVETSSYAVDEADGLYIDSFYIPAAGEQTNLIVLTTGVHGMEGYIGSVMLDVFFEEIYPQLNENTGVLTVANVNPYGMKYYRRYNENNVDLNRNFILDWDSFDLASNKEYPKVKEFLGPTGEIGNAL